MKDQSLSSLAFRNILFTILQPGMVAGVIPYIIAKENFQSPFAGHFAFHHYLALLLFLAGFIVMLHCIARFATEGRGTLSPTDPTKQLVISGLYRFSRNPMYVGVMMMLLGEALFVQSFYLLIYSAVIAIAFSLFIMLREEPRLRKDFGKAYEEYCLKVRRWV